MHIKVCTPEGHTPLGQKKLQRSICAYEETDILLSLNTEHMHHTRQTWFLNDHVYRKTAKVRRDRYTQA
jgi:hypothetical protein